MTDFIPLMNRAAIAAADVILEVYREDFERFLKADGSPVTLADQKAEAVILDMLKETGLPGLAEESAAEGRIPELGERYFVVDPLDGTKEFLKRNGEFTVNIAYIEGNRPKAGVVLAPATGAVFWGDANGAFEGEVAHGVIINSRPIEVAKDGPMLVVGSRSHRTGPMDDLCQLLGVEADVSVGSSLKFCLLARGKARLYPRFTPTCEWDTAAGQAVLEAAGGVVLGLDGEPFTYGHADRKFLNPFFVAAATLALGRQAAAEMTRLTR